MIRNLTFFTILLSLVSIVDLQAQSVFRFNGILQNDEGKPLSDVKIYLEPLGKHEITGASGQFIFEYTGVYDVTLVVKGIGSNEFRYPIKPNEINSTQANIVRLPAKFVLGQNDQTKDDIPIITLTDDNDNSSGSSSEVSSLLTSSRDNFISTANFNLFTFRFRLRGYDNEYNSFFLNGVPMSDPESGNLVFGEWGGLNDVMRNVTVNYGLNMSSFSIGKPGSNLLVDTRASQMFKTKRISYAVSNRTYRNRIMATYNTGQNANGWSFSFSGSYRWAQEGYIPGTFYKGFSYFGGVEKAINAKHSLGLTVLGSSLNRGNSAASTLEVYDLAGDNYYNPNWGYQNGDVRNSRTTRVHKPIGILRHDWKFSKNTVLTTAVSYQTGYESRTRLDWLNARDPRPDYYRYLPSGAIDSNAARIIEDSWRNNESTRQVNWNYMYQVNRQQNVTVNDADGIPGNNVTGKRSQYILEDQKQTSSIINWNSYLETVLTDNITMYGGLKYQSYKSSNFKVMDDLLGGDFWVDVDKFTARDFPELSAQNNVASPNRLIKEGDKYGFNYDINVQKMGAWAQTAISLQKFDVFIGGSFDRQSFFRKGLYQNGRFLTTSEGKSEVLNFNEFSGKAGVTYKINGRNYLFVNGAYFSNAPLSENVFVSPRTRNEIIDNPTNETIRSIEGGYILTAPNSKLRITGYLSDFNDGIQMYRFYNDDDNSGDAAGFYNQIVSNIDRRHTGIEFYAEQKLTSAWRVSLMASIGKYYYTSRFNSSYYQDYEPTLLIKNRTIYSKNYYVPGLPQQAGSFGISYNSPKFWFINLNANYARKSYVSPFWDRRTVQSVGELPLESALRAEIIEEEELSPMFTLDMFGGKSWKFGSRYLNLNIGINNLLNNKTIITNGYEQSRLALDDNNLPDINRFPNKYYYAFGLNYFASLTFRF